MRISYEKTGTREDKLVSLMPPTNALEASDLYSRHSILTVALMLVREVQFKSESYPLGRIWGKWPVHVQNGVIGITSS